MNIFSGGKEAGLFDAFIAPKTDRRLFLEALLKARNVPFTTVTLAKRQHIIVRFEGDAYNPFFRLKTVIAHYDRSEGGQGLPPSPGANDNSAACFQLVSLAESLLEIKDHNMMIVFTAGEEAGRKGVRSQGAYALATGLKKLKELRMVESDVFVIDACGRGDTLILSSSGASPLSRAADEGGKESRHLSARQRKLVKAREELREKAAFLARKSCPERWLELPTPYSDNAGFAAAGIPAQLITVLPHREAEILMEAVPRIGHDKLLRELASFKEAEKNGHSAAIPQTWKDMHTERDVAAALAPEAFALMEKFLKALALDKTPL